MRSYATFLVLTGMFLACEDASIDSDSLVGTWALTEVLADPGDGSGTFQPVESDQTITISDDFSFSANYNLCHFNSDEVSVGTIDTTAMILNVENCQVNNIAIDYRYEVNESNELIVYLPCIEPCANKFVKE